MWRKLVLGLTCVMVCGVANANECLRYNDDVSLQGRLIRETFAEQPNYENIANGDAKATYFFIAPATPLCVEPGKIDIGDIGESHVKIVQLIFMSKEDLFGPLKPFIGREVHCSGKVIHAISGHHHSRILLTTSNCGFSENHKN